MAIEDIARQLGNGLGETLAVHPSDAPHVRYATVAAVNADGTLDVTIDGTTLRGVCATTGCVGAAEGMRCVVLRQGPLATVVGLVASHDLGNIVLPNRKSIFGTDSNGVPLYAFEPRNLNDNAAINYRGYADANSSTEIYGDTIYLVSNNGVSLNGKYLPDGNVTGILVKNYSNVTTTSTTTIGSLTHTSKTGHVFIMANMVLATSRYTSSMQVYGQNTLFINRWTNINSPIRIDGMAHAYPSRGASITYTLRMASQDTGTTATFPSYNSAELFVIDI